MSGFEVAGLTLAIFSAAIQCLGGEGERLLLVLFVAQQTSRA